MDSKDSSGAQSANKTPTLNVENRRMTRSATRALQQQQAGPSPAVVSENDDQAPPPSTNKTQASKVKKEDNDDEKPKKAVRAKKQAKKNLTAPATNKKRKATTIKKEETDEDEDDEKPMKTVRVKKELDTTENLSALPVNNKRKASEITKDEDDDDYKPEQASDIKDEEEHTPKKVAPVKKMMKLGGEKRLRKFRDEPPKHWQGVYDRAQTERFYVLSRTRVGTESRPEEYVEMTGSTGNIYTVHIGLRITCTCPHHMRGFAQCKHICFVMKKVLNAPDELLYQQALLSTELQSIFESAPDISASQSQPESQEESEKRKPIEGDCPICYCELKKEDEKKPSLVWCAAACGHNFHSQCFKLWARNKSGAGVTCPMCRSAWKGDGKLEAVVEKSKAELSEGYLNVGDQLGVGRVRDTSTYSRGSREYLEELAFSMYD